MDKSHILGIDVGTGTIKVFSGTLTSDKNFNINRIGLMPAVGFDKGVITDCRALSNSIRQAVDCSVSVDALEDRHAYVGIGGMGISSVNCLGSVAPLSPKAITYEDIERVCRSAVISNIPAGLTVLHVLPMCFWVDKERQESTPVGLKGTCLEVEAHIVTVPEAKLKELLTSLEKMGINVKGVVANSIVGTRALPLGDTNDSSMILDIGAGTTEMSLCWKGAIHFSASLPLGGNYITRDIMKALEVSEQHAEGIKHYYSRLDRALFGQSITLDCNDYGTTDKQVSYDFLSNVIESRVEEIVFFIQDSVRALLASNPISKILFTGGCSAMPSFVVALEKSFGVKVQTKVPDKLQAEYAHPSNTACYGIMLHAAENVDVFKAEPLKNSWCSVLKKIKKLF